MSADEEKIVGDAPAPFGGPPDAVPSAELGDEGADESTATASSAGETPSPTVAQPNQAGRPTPAEPDALVDDQKGPESSPLAKTPLDGSVAAKLAEERSRATEETPEAPASDRVRRKPNFESLAEGHQAESTWPGLKVRSAANVPPLRRWAFLALPAIALAEIALHASQVGPLATEGQWTAVLEEARRVRKEGDLFVVAPIWYAPVARMHAGRTPTGQPTTALADLASQGYADASRFPRALEVAVGGEENPDTRDWPVTSEKIAGKLHLRVRENPHFVPVIFDLLTTASQGKVEATVATGDNQSATCTFRHSARGRMRDGGHDAWGTFISADAYQCPGVPAPMSVTVLADHKYQARRCMIVPTADNNRPIVLRFPDVHFGAVLEGHHGIHSQSENHDRHGQAVDIDFGFDAENPQGEVERRRLGADTHVDGESWKAFRIDTAVLAGKIGDLYVTIRSKQGDRPYCWEAVTR